MIGSFWKSKALKAETQKQKTKTEMENLKVMIEQDESRGTGGEVLGVQKSAFYRG